MNDLTEPWGGARGSSSKHWTEQEMRRLKSMVHMDRTDEEIAEELGRTMRGVAIKRQRLGLTIRQLPRGIRISARVHALAERLAGQCDMTVEALIEDLILEAV